MCKFSEQDVFDYDANGYLLESTTYHNRSVWALCFAASFLCPLILYFSTIPNMAVITPSHRTRCLRRALRTSHRHHPP